MALEVTAEQAGGHLATGFGQNSKAFFLDQRRAWADRRLHVAFMAPNRGAVDAFYQVVIAAGAADNGAPGLRPAYRPNYYAAFGLDPDGHNIEAVCHKPV